MKRLTAMIAALALAGCSTGGTITTTLAKPETLAAAIAIVKTYNDAGIDPVKLGPNGMAALQATCLTFALLSPIIAPPESTPEEDVAIAENICALVAEVAK